MEQKNTFSLLFYIKKNRLNKKKEAPIYFRITANGTQIALSLHRSIKVDMWNTDSGLAIGKTKSAKDINNSIKTVEAKIYEHYRIIRETKLYIVAKDIKNAFLGIKENEEKKILEIFEEHNNDVRKLINIDFAPETVQRYEVSLMHTRNFIKLKYSKDDLYLNEIDREFITNYEMYFKTVRKCSHNTTMKYIKNFKKIIRIALANGWLSNDPFANYKMKLKKVEREFLTEEELNNLINKNFKIKRLEQVRDCFIFSCFTGLAHSDLKRLSTNNIKTGTNGKLWIMINRKKTNNSSHIPILPITQILIDKYKDNPYCLEKDVLLPVLTNQKMNAYLKEVADLCGIEKHLTSHIARHTFATTVTLNNDVPIETVSKMLGHSSINMTKIYAKLLDNKVGRDMEHLQDKFNFAI